MEQEFELQQIIKDAKESLPYFIKHIFSLSFKKKQFEISPHTWKWGKRIQENNHTATLSARKHLKSTTMYAFIMWLIFKMNSNERGSYLYMSYNQKMSVYHTTNIKQLIQSNPYFTTIKDVSSGSSILNYTWEKGDSFLCTPSGILTFNRGWHGDGVICDDILADPTNELNFTIIEKINRTFFEQVMSLPKEGGWLHLVGTAQHQMDLFFKLKENKSWNWAEYKAILNEAEQEVLWPELFSYKRLCEIREQELGEKAFKKEYMCSPIWSEEAYFQREEFMKAVDVDLEECKRSSSEFKHRKMKIVAGLDIGKKTHPSHFVVFMYDNGRYTQLYEKFMDGWDYYKQIVFINDLVEFFLIDSVYYDDTRGELESFREQRIISPAIWKPIVFKVKTKFEMASNLDRLINHKDGPKVSFLNRQRMIDSVLSMNNNLEAPESIIGHGDAFWSIALALYESTTPTGSYWSV